MGFGTLGPANVQCSTWRKPLFTENRILRITHGQENNREGRRSRRHHARGRQAAGVSIKTVSNVVNDYEFVSDATRAKVHKAIDELGYVINVSARNLRRGSTGIIALASQTCSCRTSRSFHR